VTAGTTIVQSREPGTLDLRSGDPHAQSTATITHPINGDGHLLSALSLSFAYAAGYTPPAGQQANASTLTVVLVDAINGSTVQELWTSPPLGNYSFDRFEGYSPPVAVNITGLAVAWPRSLRVALRFTNHDRNVQVPLASIEVFIRWMTASEPSGFSPSDLSTPAANLAAVRRGPLLFALPLHPTAKTLHMPAQGGECETQNRSACRSRDVEFALGEGTAFNYALVLGQPTFRRKASAAGELPFNPEAPPVTVTATARRVARWKTVQDGRVAESPPASPLDCTPSDGCGETESIELVPFGSPRFGLGHFRGSWPNV
jgi:hypothetical protein